MRISDWSSDVCSSDLAIWQRSAASLSGGQAQRAWLGMILAQNTDLILLDEPTSALDIGHQAEVMEAVHQIAAAGRTVLIVIHDLGVAARYCDEDRKSTSLKSNHY